MAKATQYTYTTSEQAREALRDCEHDVAAEYGAAMIREAIQDIISQLASDSDPDFRARVRREACERWW